MTETATGGNARLPLTLACGEYDRTYPLRDGRAPVEGVDLNYLVLEIRELMMRQARFAEFQASEFSLSTHMLLHARGDRRFVGIPVFPSRHFRHQNVWISARKRCGMKAPRSQENAQIL